MALFRSFLLGAVAVCTALAQPVEVAPGVLRLGFTENPAVTESSGLASSRNRSAFWTHNDGGPDILYSATTNGASLTEWKIKDVELDNWEDLSRAGSQLYIADIGNDTLSRETVQVFRVTEPSIKFSGETRPNRMWRLHYPAGPFDAESLFVARSFGYVIPREPTGEGAQVYRFPLNRGVDVTLEPQFTLNVQGVVTAAAISPDKKRLAVITSAGAYLFILPKKMPTTGLHEPFDFVSYASNNTEGCAFTRNGLLVTGENQEILLFTAEPFREKWKMPKQR